MKRFGKRVERKRSDSSKRNSRRWCWWSNTTRVPRMESFGGGFGSAAALGARVGFSAQKADVKSSTGFVNQALVSVVPDTDL